MSSQSSLITRFFYLTARILLFSTGLLQTVQAQEFFTPTNHAWVPKNTHFQVLPGGYELRNTFRDPNETTRYYFGNLHIDASGQETGWDSISHTASINFTGPSFTWLPDNTLLEMEYSFGDIDWIIRDRQLDGTVLWEQPVPQTLSRQAIREAVQNEAGDIFISGSEWNPIDMGGAWQTVLSKYSAGGELLWSLRQPEADSSLFVGTSSTTTSDGGCIYNIGVTKSFSAVTSILQKISASGQVQWADTVDYYMLTPLENSQGDVFSPLLNYDGSSSTSVAKLQKHAETGQLLWTQDLNSVFQQANVVLNYVVLAQNGDLLITGNSSDAGSHYKNFFARFDPDGQLLWVKNYQFLADRLGYYPNGYIVGGQATADNGFILTGQLPIPQSTLFILKMDANGHVYPGQISGRTAIDTDVDCLVDSTETGLANWKIQLAGPNITLYTTSDSTGQYSLQDVPGGNYQLLTTLPSNLWESCAAAIPVVVPDTGSTTFLHDLPVQALTDCPFMTVDIGTPVLRPCFSSTYSVQYSNQGTAADSAYIQVILPPLLHFSSASIPYTQNGTTLHFELGSVPSLGSGSFTFEVMVDCDSAQLGQTVCVSASIFPDTICNPPLNWSGALLEGSGYCEGDSIRFQLQNIGTVPTSNGLKFIIVDDHVIMFNKPLPTVQPGNSHNVTVPANGTTWRMIADQEPNAPGLEMPSVGVEGCGAGPVGFLHFMLQFANYDGNPFTDTDCHEVVGSFDPNDKQAFPTGLDAPHFIEPNTALEYQLRFQNTGTATATMVVLKDTLSAWLDPATIRPGAASHPYTWTLSGTGILTFTFQNILLPDSNANEAASHGFIQFSIDQRPENPLGALLENRAGIYFDFNAPVMTNTVWHTIGHNFLTSSLKEPRTAQSMLQIWPNPANDLTIVTIDEPFRQGQQLIIRNVFGTIVQEIAVRSTSMELRRADNPPGLYFLELRESGKVKKVGKMVWK